MRILLVAMLAILATACGEPTQAPETETDTEGRVVAPGSTSIDSGTPISPIAMSQWSRNCALCHVRGEGGAPVLGDTEAWAPRIAQGDEVLLTHTLEGLNNMPPLGYCMDCEEGDFRQIIAFMSGSLSEEGGN